MKLTSRVLQIGLVLAALAVAASSHAQTLNRYWGDLQGDNSQLGTPTQYFSFGRDSVGLDVVALTAHAMKEELDRCLTAGCDTTMTKPVTKKDLIEKLASVLAGAKPVAH